MTETHPHSTLAAPESLNDFSSGQGPESLRDQYFAEKIVRFREKNLTENGRRFSDDIEFQSESLVADILDHYEGDLARASYDLRVSQRRVMEAADGKDREDFGILFGNVFADFNFRVAFTAAMALGAKPGPLRPKRPYPERRNVGFDKLSGEVVGEYTGKWGLNFDYSDLDPGWLKTVYNEFGQKYSHDLGVVISEDKETAYLEVLTSLKKVISEEEKAEVAAVAAEALRLKGAPDYAPEHLDDKPESSPETLRRGSKLLPDLSPSRLRPVFQGAVAGVAVWLALHGIGIYADQVQPRQAETSGFAGRMVAGEVGLPFLAAGVEGETFPPVREITGVATVYSSGRWEEVIGNRRRFNPEIFMDEDSLELIRMHKVIAVNPALVDEGYMRSLGEKVKLMRDHGYKDEKIILELKRDVELSKLARKVLGAKLSIVLPDGSVDRVLVLDVQNASHAAVAGGMVKSQDDISRESLGDFHPQYLSDKPFEIFWNGKMWERVGGLGEKGKTPKIKLRLGF